MVNKQKTTYGLGDPKQSDIFEMATTFMGQLSVKNQAESFNGAKKMFEIMF